MSLALGVSESELLEFAKSIRMIAEKSLEGHHLSNRSGEGLEFHSSNPYFEGEDSRFIDWKRYAATDKYFVKKYERQEKISWKILIDQSLSMNYGNKSRWTSQFAGCLLYIAQSLGDRWVLEPFERRSLEEAFQDLLSHRTGFDFSSKDLWDLSVQSSDRIVLISDLFFDSKNLASWVDEHLESCKEMNLIHLLDEREKKFDFSGVLEFQDFESQHKLLLDSKSVRGLYLQSLEDLQNFWKQKLKFKGRFIEMIADSALLPKDLREFFQL